MKFVLVLSPPLLHLLGYRQKNSNAQRVLGQLPHSPHHINANSAMMLNYYVEPVFVGIVMWWAMRRGIWGSLRIFPRHLVSHDSLSSIKFNECPSNARIALYFLDKLLYLTFYFC